MATPSKKTPLMVDVLDKIALATTGRTRTESIQADLCVWCGKEAKVFKDELSRREYTISGMCQECQDKLFLMELL